MSNFHLRPFVLTSLWLLSFLLAACQPAAPSPSPTASATAAPTATATASPSPRAEISTHTPQPTPEQSALVERWKPAIGGAAFNRLFCEIMLQEATKHQNGELNSFTLFAEQLVAAQALNVVAGGQADWQPTADLAEAKQRVVADTDWLSQTLDDWRSRAKSSAQVIAALTAQCPALADYEDGLVQRAFTEGLTRASYQQLLDELLDDLRRMGIPIP